MRMEKEKTFINFKVDVDELYHFSCHSSANTSHAVQDAFRMKDKYFYYFVNKNPNASTYSLRQITAEQFEARKKEILKKRPHRYASKWVKDGNRCQSSDFINGFWQKTVAAEDCCFDSETSELKEIWEAVVNEATIKREQEAANERERKKKYSRQCGGLGEKLGVEFLNVMHIGPDKGKLMRFKESYERAMTKIAKLPLSEQKKLYNELFKQGRAKRKAALERYDVDYAAADVSRLDLSRLQQQISEKLETYKSESLKTAIHTAADLDFTERSRFYDILSSSSHAEKKKVLTALGVDITAVDPDRYPISVLRNAIGATLGLGTEY